MCADGFQNLLMSCCWKKTKLRFLLAPIKIRNNSENSFINPLHQHYSSDFDSEIYKESRLWHVHFWRIFKTPMRDGRWRTLTNQEGGGNLTYRKYWYNLQNIYLMRLNVFTYSAAWMSENHNQPILQKNRSLFVSFKPYFYSTVFFWDYSSLE